MTDMDRRGWHIDKGVPLAVIVTVIFTLGGLVYSSISKFAQQDERIGKVELTLRYQQKSRENARTRTAKQFDEMKTDLRSINAKLDRLIESDR